MATLDLSMVVDPLKVGYVLGRPYAKSVIYKTRATPADPFVVTAWPQAPVLDFKDPALPNITATLTAEGAVTNARATFAMTVEQVAALDAARSKSVQFVLGAEALYSGLASKRA